MAVRPIPAVAALVVWCAAAAGQESAPVLPPPAARLAPPGTELPPLLTVPPPPAVPVLPPAAPCRSCPTDYHPGYTYLPDQDPDWSRGGCDGECRACRTTWVAAELLFGVAKDLGEVDYRKTLGVWLGGGHWFDDARTAGIDLGIFATSDKASVSRAGPTFLDASFTLWTIDANLRAELFEAGQWRITGLVGYRYLYFREQLVIGSALAVADEEARNEVNAAQVGLVAAYRLGPYTCATEAKVAVGRNQRRTGLNGFGPAENDVAIIPEFATRVGYQVGEGKWCTFGYRALYLNNILRPGRGETDFFLHGLTVGFEMRF
jgi:Putative beta barrel porin-7 (BBP7)